MRTLPSANRLSEDQRETTTVSPMMLFGIACSAGRATGTARIVRNIEDWARVRTGDIVVCEVMPASWTPFFAMVGGVVCDRGGVLSNAAIVAREYKLPSVVGTKVGTKVIRDGQRIAVDGESGCVQLDA